MRFAWVYDQAWSKVDRASKILMSPFLAHNLNFCQNLWKQSVILWWVFCDLNIIRVQHILNKSGPKLEPLSTKTYGSTQFKLVVGSAHLSNKPFKRNGTASRLATKDQLFTPVDPFEKGAEKLNARYAHGVQTFICVYVVERPCNFAVPSLMCAHTVRLIILDNKNSSSVSNCKMFQLFLRVKIFQVWLSLCTIKY